MKFRASILLGSLMLAALARPAGAHVRIAPLDVRPGSIDELTFRCPNERANSATTKLVIELPPEYPFASITLRQVPGWHADLTMRKLDTPLQTDHGNVASAVDTITWSGGSIGPGERQNFVIRAGPMPQGVHELVFRAIQTYASGEIVRWIELREAGQPEPPHPAPVLEVR